MEQRRRWKHSALRHVADEADVYTLTSSARRPYGYDIIREVRVQKLVKQSGRRSGEGGKKKESVTRKNRYNSYCRDFLSGSLTDLLWGNFKVHSKLPATDV